MTDGNTRDENRALTAVAAGMARRTISPYDLSPSDNPGCVISQPLLRGSNYDEWAANLRLALMARKKFGFVDGSIQKPETNSNDLEDWLCNNALVVSWIKLTVEPSLRTTLQIVDVGRDLWELIRKRFSVKNGAKIGKVKTELAMAQQGGKTVEAYFGYMNQLWSTLSDYRRPKSCRCGACTCNLTVEIEKERDEDRVHEFLRGLDESFTHIRSNLLSRVPFPSLDDVYLAVTQEEDSRSVGFNQERRVDGVSFATRAVAQYEKRGDRNGGRLVCKVCGKSGHTADRCYGVIGYPDWWGDRPRTSGDDRARNRDAKSFGERTVAVPRNRGSNSVNATGAARPVASHTANAVLGEEDRTGVVGLSNSQWQSLVRMLEERDIEKTTRLSGKDFLNSWIYDTGASHHMTGTVECLENLCDMPEVVIKLPDGRFSVATRQGSVSLGNGLVLKRVYFAEGLRCHLISVSQLTRDNKCVFQITDKLCIVQDRITRILIGAGEQINGLYFFRTTDIAGSVQHSEKISSSLMHRRLGHPSPNVVSRLVTSGISVLNDFNNKTCEVCIRAKQTREVFNLSCNKTTEIFQLVHVDLWGPYRTPAMCGSRYFLTVLDDHSRAVWIYLLKSKTEVPEVLKSFVAFVERQFDTKIRTIRSDNGSEFVVMTNYFRGRGIIHETSCVATPQQNGRVERKHRHILNVARALRFQANLPIEFWGHCALTACYLINRTPTDVLKGKTPFEMMYKRPPPLGHLRVFGSLCFAHNRAHDGDKFASRSIKCIFIGYPFGKKGWKVYDLETKKILVSRDVMFFEEEFVFKHNLNTNIVETDVSSPSQQQMVIFDEFDSEVRHDRHGTDCVRQDTVNIGVDVSADNGGDTHQCEADVSTDSVPHNSSSEPSRRSSRQKTPNIRLSDYVVTTHAMVDQPVSDVTYPISAYLSCEKFSKSHQTYLHAVLANEVPRSYKQAMEDEKWRVAVQNELNALEANGTWDLVSIPTGKRAIGCQWVFTIKYRADGSIERHKARLVVLGNKQAEGVDYDETFAPVAKMTTVRCFLEVSAARNWEVHQMDVHNAFLHGDLHEEVYMRPPPGFFSDDKTTVCLLKKSLYGLKQAPRCWFEKLRSALITYGFLQAQSDHSLFTMVKNGTRTHLLVYVDDLILTGDSPHVLREFKDYLGSCFKMKDLGILKYFLGIEVARNASGIYLCQRKYALDIVAECGLLGAKPVSFPLDQNHRLAVVNSPILEDPTPYRRLVGRLIYLRETRPELSYAIHILSQFMQRPLQAHWDAALRVVRYIKGNPGQGILLRSDSPLVLQAWCDADHAGCPLTRRSLTGWFIQLGQSPISWKTKKQPTVSLSSAEAEYRAMQFTVKEVIWLRALISTLGVQCDRPVSLHCDNMAAIHISANPVFHERTKHVESDCHFVREKIQDGTIVTNYVSTKTQLADIFTKALGRQEFDFFQSKLGVLNLHAPS